MKSTLKIAAFLIATCSLSSAASIIAGNLVDVDFADPSQALLALDSTFTAKVGFLSNEALTTSSVFSTINANWTNAGNITFATGDADGFSGYFSGQVNFTDVLGLAGKSVFIWVTDGANKNAVLKSTDTLFLADAATPNSNSVTIDAASLDAPAPVTWNILLGTRTLTGPNSVNGGSVALNVVPEPSAVLLSGLGVLVLLRRRRN